MENARFWLSAIAAFSLLLFASGCTLGMLPQDSLSQSDLTLPVYNNTADYICKGENGPLGMPCICFTCTSHSTLLTMLIPWYDASLLGGTCQFEECNYQTFTDSLDGNSDVQPRTFMFSHGPSFYSTEHANKYCSYSLQFATKWMPGDLHSIPRVPMRQRAECWLERNTLPLFIYYTNGERIDAARTLQIAQEFQGSDGGAGPVMVTTELGFDSSSANAIAAVRGQIDAYATCDKCLTILAVKSGDRHGVDEILGNPYYYGLVDMVGFGFRANDYAHCDLDKILDEQIAFSQYVLKKYHKPTIWLYAGASQGGSSDGSCQWDANMVHQFYGDLFSLSDSLGRLGIVGMSFYEFSDQTGPLPCDSAVQGCNFGVMDGSFKQKHPEMNSWSTYCNYFSDYRPTEEDKELYRAPIVFSRNGQGAVCDAIMPSNKLYNVAPIEVNADIANDPAYSNAVLPYAELDDPELRCGEVCVSDEEIPDKETYDDANCGTAAHPVTCGFPSSHCPGKDEFGMIDELADSFDISNIYFRATVQQESNFNRYAVSCIPRLGLDGTPNSQCNPAELTMAQICSYVSDPLCPGAFTCPPADDGREQKPCAYGLTQCIEYPGAYYTATSQSIPASISQCGGANYDPFDPSDSICCGIRKFASYLDDSREFVETNWNDLSFELDGTCDDAIDGVPGNEERPWTEYYLASQQYNSGKIPDIYDFLYQRDDPSLCSGEDHYIKWVRSEYGDYGAQVMTRYLLGLDRCDSSCPH